MLFIPPVLLGILLLLGGFEDRLLEQLATPPPDTSSPDAAPPPALPDAAVPPAADDRLPIAET
ncbi:hypothetical protein AB0442_37620 [Kitasatospora sp. NPDC085895]|uniref:hypothetical protein n=1 Tax=Kitasatospora sp. NPDC085895 TaxID=3155057 RepID=UPI00344EA235